MAFTYKIFNSRTGEEVLETKDFDPTEPSAFAEWMDTNNKCYEPDDVNKPENDACDYQIRTYVDGNQVFFNPVTGQMDLTEQPDTTPVDPASDEASDGESVDFV